MITTDRISLQELEDFVEEQKDNLVFAIFRELSATHLTRYGREVCPQEILYKVLDSEQFDDGPR